MAAHTEPLLHHLQSWLCRANADRLDDATLLERFVSRRDEAAFAAILALHGPMVHGVCRRILRDQHDAEDAFQATFLLLARKAGGLRHPETLAAWLYGVARRLALTAQRSNSRRRQHERKSADAARTPASANPLDDLSARELLLALDDEIARLPERYRLPLILCGLEGRSQAEAARLLGWSVDSVRGRLERGRARLRARLVRRGLTLGASLLTLESMATATVSAVLRQVTVRKALAFTAGSAEGIAANIIALVESGSAGMTVTKAKVGMMLLLAVGLAGGAGVLAYPLQSEQQPEQKQAATKSRERQLETNQPARDKTTLTDLYGDPLPSGAIARLGTLRFRHGSFLQDALLSPDGRTLFSAGDDALEWWDVQSGVRQRQVLLSGLNHRVAGIDLSPDGKLLALSSQVRSKVRFWDAVSGAEVYPFGDDAPEVGRAKFSPTGELLATFDLGNQGTVSIWDIRKRKKIRTIEGGDRFSSASRSLAFSPDGKLLAFPLKNGVRVWSLAADKEVYQLDVGAKRPMGCVAFSSDGSLLAAAMSRIQLPGEEDHAIHLWATATGKEVGVLKGHKGLIRALAMSPKDNLLASASADQTIRFWDLAKRREIGPSLVSIEPCPALSFSADGSVLAAGHNLGALRLWDVRKHEEITTPSAGSGSVEWVGFAPDGQTLISAAAGQLGLWDALTGRPRHLFQCANVIVSPVGRSVALSPDGKSLATMSNKIQEGALQWDVATGKQVRRLNGSSYALTFSPDGRLVAGASYPEGTIHIWETAGGKELLQLKGPKNCHCLSFSPDGAALAAAGGWANTEMTVRLWKLATGEGVWQKSTHPWAACDLQFSPDGRTLALVGAMPGRSNVPGEFHLWEAATGKELKHFDGLHFPVRCVAFSADGRMLATGSADSAVRLWEVASGRERQILQGHQNGIKAVSFSPDGRLLASSSFDTTALVWDLTDRFRDGRFHSRRLSAEELDRCWADLAHDDAARAYRSVLSLTGSPKESVVFLRDHLQPVIAANPMRVAPLLASLDSPRFAERDKARTEMEKLGLAVEPVLRSALNAKPSLEVRRRIEEVLEKVTGVPRLRYLRALEVLEHIATPEARQLLESLSQGTAEMWPAQEAKASLARLSASSPEHHQPRKKKLVGLLRA